MTGRRSDRRDALCILLLTLVCLALRLPALDRIALNPDESQYEATAAYLLATGTSAFALPHTSGGSFALWKLVSWLFGPYPMLEMRILVLIVCLAMAILLYAMLRTEVPPLFALGGATIFLHYNLWFEGWTANREWFSGLFVLGAASLYLLAERYPGREASLLFLAGAGCTGALAFKMQAAYLVLVVPVVLLLRAAARRRLQGLPRRLLLYAAGLATGLAVYFAQFLFAGTLDDYLASILTDARHYAGGDQGGGVAGGFLRALYLAQPWRMLLLAGYLMAALALARMAKRPAQDGPRSHQPDAALTPLFAVYLVAALLAVSMGQRYFGHYYLYLMPALAGLLGAGAHRVWKDRHSFAGQFGALVLLVVLLFDRASVAGVQRWDRLIDAFPRTWPFWLYLTVGIGVLVLWATAPLRRAPAAFLALLVLECGALLFQTHRLPVPPSFPHHPGGFARLQQALDAVTGGRDRLFVWGWLPELYSLTRLEPASQFVVTQYIVDDVRAAPFEPTILQQHARLMMQDLNARPPRFVVDASRRSWTMQAQGDPWIYDLELYPDFEFVDFLRRRYVSSGSYDGCDLYVRRDVDSGG